MNYAKLMAQATQLRTELGEDSLSPVDIIALAQTIDKLTIVYYPFGEKVSGMCIKGQKGKSLIAINSAMTLGRQRFSLAHEFYHLYFDNSMVSICSMLLNANKGIEKEADIFASYFLMPEAALFLRAKKILEENKTTKLSLSDVIKIEQYFGLSHQATIYRLMHTPLLRDEDGDLFLSISVRSKAESLGYSSALYEPAPKSKQFMTYGHYIKQVEDSFENNLISQGKYEELLIDAFRSDLVYGNEEEEETIID